MMFLVTDGSDLQEKKLVTQAGFAKNAGITLVTVGIGTEVNKDLLSKIASEDPDAADAKYFFYVDDYDGLNQLLDKFTKVACQELCCLACYNGCEQQETEITVLGTGFGSTPATYPDRACKIGDLEPTPAKYVSNTEVICVIPPRADDIPEVVDIKVSMVGGGSYVPASSPLNFTYHRCPGEYVCTANGFELPFALLSVLGCCCCCPIFLILMKLHAAIMVPELRRCEAKLPPAQDHQFALQTVPREVVRRVIERKPPKKKKRKKKKEKPKEDVAAYVESSDMIWIGGKWQHVQDTVRGDLGEYGLEDSDETSSSDSSESDPEETEGEYLNRKLKENVETVEMPLPASEVTFPVFDNVAEELQLDIDWTPDHGPEPCCNRWTIIMCILWILCILIIIFLIWFVNERYARLDADVEETKYTAEDTEFCEFVSFSKPPCSFSL
eukprot:g1691.t1